jgi:hypothetical protein
MWNWSTTALARAFTRLLVITLMSMTCGIISAAETKAPLIFSGGHETDAQDHGRPVVLVAAALGVTPEVFREAFRGVTPARGGKPSPEEARRNKEALMKVLKPHGVSNERLDEVSNYYRYQPQRGQLWKATPAEGYAVVEDGKVKCIVMTQPGSGYSTPPQARVKGVESTPLKVSLHFDKDLKKNGSIGMIEVAPPKSPKTER